MYPRLKRPLTDVRRRLQRSRFLILWTLGFLLVTATFLAIVSLSISIPVGRWELLAGIVAVAAVVWGIAAWQAKSSHLHDRALAARIEAQHPELQQRLLTALDQQPDQEGNWSYLQHRLFDELLKHERTRNWTAVVSSTLMGWLQIAAVFAVIMFAAASFGLINLQRTSLQSSLLAAVDNELESVVTIEPGDVEVERGNGLTVTALFPEHNVPSDAQLTFASGDATQVFAMRRNLDDPLFGCYLSTIDQAGTYQVRTESYASREFEVRVFEFPRLVRSDAAIAPPEYTRIEPKLVEDTLRISAVEGSTVTWTMTLNKPVTSAKLIGDEGDEILLGTTADNRTVLTTQIVVDVSRRWKLQLLDEEGRENKFPPTFVIKAIENKPVDLKLVSALDAVVSPIEELPIAAEVRDDFGVARSGLTLSINGRDTTEVDLTPTVSNATNQQLNKTRLDHLVDFEKLNAEPDQLLSYHFWAEDIGPDGKPRRTTSDIFFAEVRPFEQIFREGEGSASQQQQQQQQGASGPQAQQAEQLAELQKQIVSAIWNTIRRADLEGERGDPALIPSIVPDVQTIADSQRQASEQLQQLTESLPPDRSPELVAVVSEMMLSTIEHLDAAVEQLNQQPLQDAFRDAQAAYGAMLRLRAREFDVVQSNQQQSQQGGSSGRSQMQQQLDQLELKNDPNRYEQENQAQDGAANQQNALQDIASQLRDLARRQADLNEQLRAAELALQQAETEKQREEAQRQLERLREQQQELLRDADELNQQLREQATSDEASAEVARNTAEQLERTRENLRDAERSLEEGQPSEALAAGSRAERSLKEMQEEVQQEAAGELGEQMKELREQARKLAEEQEKIEEQLTQLDQPQSGTGLRSEENGRAELVEKFLEQSTNAEQLIDQIRETVQQAEEGQPLVANRLYEAQRRAQEGELSESLETAGELLRRGYDPQAQQVSRTATERIKQLNDEVEAAAESLLGDPTEALQRANDQLSDLAEQLTSERPEGVTNEQQGQQQGQQPGEQQGQQPGEQQGQQPGEQQGQQPGEQQGQQPGEQQGQQRGEQQGQQPGEQQGQQPGEQQGQQPGEQQGQQPGEQQGQQQAGGNRPSPGGSEGGGLLDDFWGETASGEDRPRPITGDGFREWSDRMREVEDMLDSPELRSQAAGIRDRARELRREYIRHSREPRWTEIEEMLVTPLRELQFEVSAELLRRSAEKNAIVPMDRDAVPEEFSEAVRKYYERLGASR